jgi:hypothetical protein
MAHRLDGGSEVVSPSQQLFLVCAVQSKPGTLLQIPDTSV